MLRFRVMNAEGKRVEHTLSVGLVTSFPKERDAWREVDRRGLLVRVNSDAPCPYRIRFDQLAEHYLKADFGADAVRPKSDNTIKTTKHFVRDYLIPRWGDAVAEDIEPIIIQRWLKSLHTDSGLSWPSVTKIRSVMSRIYKVGQLHGRLTKNPVQLTQTRCVSDYRAIVLTPEQTLAILKALPAVLHKTLVLTCAATALRSSEILALRWADIRWLEQRIRVSKRWAEGKDGKTKTRASDGFVPLHPMLADHLRSWHSETPYDGDDDFVFPSLRAKGRAPLSPCPFVADHLRKAAKEAGVAIADGQRFGLHNLRHSLSNWLVNKAKVEPKTVQGILRHSRIQTTLDLYTQQDNDEARAAQGEFLRALGMNTQMVQ